MNRGGIRKSLTMLPLALTVAMDEHALSPVLPFDKHIVHSSRSAALFLDMHALLHTFGNGRPLEPGRAF